MLQQMKAQIKQRKSSGFTLMELLIVIAIISVLVAIAIPTFAAQLDNAKDAADKANARALYALAQAEWMDRSFGQNNDQSGAASIESRFSTFEDHKFIANLSDGSSQAFTFSDRTDNVVVSFSDDYGAHVEVSGRANNSSGFEYPEG